jgi:uncharacterized FlgJ-related protein
MADVSIGGLAQAPQLSKKTKPKMVVSEADSPDCKRWASAALPPRAAPLTVGRTRCGTSELARSGNSYFVCRKCIASSQKAEATTKTKLTREPNQRSVAAMFQPMKSP